MSFFQSLELPQLLTFDKWWLIYFLCQFLQDLWMYLTRSYGLVNLHVHLDGLKQDLLLQQIDSSSFFCSLPLPSAALVRWLENLLVKTDKKLSALTFSMSQVTSSAISFGWDPCFLSLPFITHVSLKKIEITFLL